MASFGYLQRRGRGMGGQGRGTGGNREGHKTKRGRGTVGKRGGMGRKGEDMGGI